MALILENVGKTFENTGQATLKNINLEIQPGEFLCVVGKSGCGKSTLLNLIAGLEAPTEGRILLNGKEVKGPGSERTVMFQEHALFPWLNVIQNIKFGMKINGVPKEEQEIRAEKYLKMMQLEQYKDYAIHQLSGGMRQRVALARAFTMDSDILLMDEPFSALDEHIKRKMEVELMEMLENFHKPIIFVSHNREEIYRFADKVCSVEDGIVSRIYDKKYFYYKPETKAQAKLAGCLNFSNISWIDESHVKAVDWGVTLKVKATKESDWEKYHSICIFQNDINIGKHSFTHQKKYIKNENINSETTGMFEDTLNTLKIKSISLSEELYNTCCLCELENGEVITMIKPKENQLFSDKLQDKYIDLLNNVKKITVAKEYIHLLK